MLVCHTSRILDWATAEAEYLPVGELSTHTGSSKARPHVPLVLGWCLLVRVCTAGSCWFVILPKFSVGLQKRVRFCPRLLAAVCSLPVKGHAGAVMSDAVCCLLQVRNWLQNFASARLKNFSVWRSYACQPQRHTLLNEKTNTEEGSMHTKRCRPWQLRGSRCRLSTLPGLCGPPRQSPRGRASRHASGSAAPPPAPRSHRYSVSSHLGP